MTNVLRRWQCYGLLLLALASTSSAFQPISYGPPCRSPTCQFLAKPSGANEDDNNGNKKEDTQLDLDKKKKYIGTGEPDYRPLNDVTKPEYDDQGHMLHVDEQTGEKSRVFEALVDYPCGFKLKIVGADEGSFVKDIVQVVADSCQVADSQSIPHSTKSMGKWTSVTVQAPVQSAEMLYQLYENVDRDPRVKFKI